MQGKNEEQHGGFGVRLMMAGAGPEEAGLRRRAEQLGVDVTWLGLLGQEELGRAYGAADCLALPAARP